MCFCFVHLISNKNGEDDLSLQTGRGAHARHTMSRKGDMYWVHSGHMMGRKGDTYWAHGGHTVGTQWADSWLTMGTQWAYGEHMLVQSVSDPVQKILSQNDGQKTNSSF